MFEIPMEITYHFRKRDRRVRHESPAEAHAPIKINLNSFRTLECLHQFLFWPNDMGYIV